jgi:hypothetical protein
MNQLTIFKRTLAGAAVASAIALAGLPGLASADEDKGATSVKTVPVSLHHELDEVRFTYQKVDLAGSASGASLASDNDWKYISVRRY